MQGVENREIVRRLSASAVGMEIIYALGREAGNELRVMVLNAEQGLVSVDSVPTGGPVCGRLLKINDEDILLKGDALFQKLVASNLQSVTIKPVRYAKRLWGQKEAGSAIIVFLTVGSGELGVRVVPYSLKRTQSCDGLVVVDCKSSLLQLADKIVAVNGESLQGLTASGAEEILKSLANAPRHLTMLREQEFQQSSNSRGDTDEADNKENREEDEAGWPQVKRRYILSRERPIFALGREVRIDPYHRSPPIIAALRSLPSVPFKR